MKYYKILLEVYLNKIFLPFITKITCLFGKHNYINDIRIIGDNKCFFVKKRCRYCDSIIYEFIDKESANYEKYLEIVNQKEV